MKEIICKFLVAIQYYGLHNFPNDRQSDAVMWPTHESDMEFVCMYMDVVILLNFTFKLFIFSDCKDMILEMYCILSYVIVRK